MRSKVTATLSGGFGMRAKKSTGRAAAKRAMKDLTPRKMSNVKVAGGGRVIAETAEQQSQVRQKITS
jgi:hypothetical protein